MVADVLVAYLITQLSLRQRVMVTRMSTNAKPMDATGTADWLLAIPYLYILQTYFYACTQCYLLYVYTKSHIKYF